MSTFEKINFKMVTENQLKNLAPQFNSQTGREAGKKGGIKSGEKRRELRTFKELLEQQLSQKTSDGKVLKETITEQLLNLIKTGSEQTKLKAIEMVRDTIGEKPVEKTENNTNLTGELKGLNIEIIKTK